MFIVITQNKVYMAKTLPALNKRIGGLMDADEFKAVGSDMVCNLSPSDLDFVQDKHKLSTIMFGNFFKKDLLPRNLMIMNLVFTFIIMTKIMGMG